MHIVQREPFLVTFTGFQWKTQGFNTSQHSNLGFIAGVSAALNDSGRHFRTDTFISTTSHFSPLLHSSHQQNNTKIINNHGQPTKNPTAHLRFLPTHLPCPLHPPHNHQSTLPNEFHPVLRPLGSPFPPHLVRQRALSPGLHYHRRRNQSFLCRTGSN